jgi:hypothetical protein
MNENITVAVFYTKTCTLDNYLRQEYLKVKPQPTRSFIYQFCINAKSNDFILLVVKCLRNCSVQNSGRSVREAK